ncbi:FKBP-type peptidyl-prolyl cis-trans isomerase [Methanomethylovorans hollandica DSM 15978]|uniref:Peptidyl-prolyl cis-trans isomerase n=1 Tax=Methanomethylovorans hollandica (strain DSM 15978 / NBRC 107637 / DMS1) TaxID=867904 RepID=L0KWX7_METHD|nr:FKBP-type peptidyl-prolyl cis-trans isomerase [Methanomethylovorans hollandica DSM 15978]
MKYFLTVLFISPYPYFSLLCFDGKKFLKAQEYSRDTVYIITFIKGTELIYVAIEKGDFIKITYTGRFEDGQVFDTTSEEIAKENGIFNPRGIYGGDVVIVGSGHTIKGLDEDFVDKEVGYTGTLEIPPEKAFGVHNPALVESVSITKVATQLKDTRAYPGMEVEVDGKKGVVQKIIGRRLRVDFNHSLAGRAVTYEYTIEKKLDDSEEKARGLLALYTGASNMDMEITPELIRVIIPIEFSFNQRWLISKGRIAHELIENLGISNLEFVEKYPYAPNKDESEEPVASEEVETEE